MSRATKLARQLLERFFRDAEGRTNRQIDVYFTLQDMDLPRAKAEPAIDHLVSRGLLNTFGPDIAFLTEAGVRAVSEEADVERMEHVGRDFGAASPTEDAEPPTTEITTPRIVHIGVEGNESTVPLGWVCSVGRADTNDIPVHDQRASKRHAEFRYQDGGYVLHDLDSANGTLLNGEYVVEPMRLAPDDEIVIGRTLLLYQAPSSVPRPKGPEPGSTPPSAGTPPPNLVPTERPGRGSQDLTPIPPNINVALGQLDGPRTEDVPDAILEPPEDYPEPEYLDPAELQPIEQEDLPPSVSPPPFPSSAPAEDDPPFGRMPPPRTDSNLEPSSWVPIEPELPSGPSHTDEVDDAATIMTTREALYGAEGVPGAAPKDASSGDQPTLPPGEAATRRAAEEAEEMPEASRDLPSQTVARIKAPTAFGSLLDHLKVRLEASELSRREELLKAIDLLRKDAELDALIREVEREVDAGA